MECHGEQHPYIATDQAPVDAIRCPNWNLLYERQCEQVAGHDGWHGFMWDWNNRSGGAHWWPGQRGACEVTAVTTASADGR